LPRHQQEAQVIVNQQDLVSGFGLHGISLADPEQKT
jgi:hypothetical protein